MYEDSVDELFSDLILRAESLGIDVSTIDVSVNSADDMKMDACIRLLRAMFEVMRQGLMETSSELEHMYDACYQTFHDMLEPTRNIWKLSSLMISDQKDGKIPDPRYAEVINSSSYFLMMMLDDLMNLTVLRRRRGELSERFSLTIAADQAVEHLFSQIRERNAIVNVERDLPVLISNRSRWTRIFQNLVKNAITYNSSEIPVVNISFDDGIVYITDNGLGIEEADRGKIFGLFTRLRDRKHMAEGTGSGLYQVSRLLVDDHASIDVLSKIGEGSTFRIDVRTLLRLSRHASV